MAEAAQAMAEVQEPNDVEQVLHWIGFNWDESEMIADEIGDNLNTFLNLTTKDITTLASNFEKRDGDEKIIFKMVRTNMLKDVIPWAVDQQRVGEEPSIGILDQPMFLAELSIARKREIARKAAAETMETRAKEASPGKLTGHKNWETWLDKLINYLSIMTGVLDVPLIYVIREEIATYLQDNEGEADDFIKTCIAECPHDGEFFRDDARRVHELLTSFCIGEESESFLKPLRPRHDGKRDMAALMAHYEGPGYQTRRVADAERLRDTLHYKSESALPFDTFITKCKKMFNTFDLAGEPYQESAKLRFLLDKCEGAPAFTAMISAIRSAMTLDDGAYDFDRAASALTAQIKPTTRSIRGINAVATGEASPAIMKDGKINTGRYRNWRSLSESDRAIVMAERQRLNIKGRGGKRGRDGKKIQNQKKVIKDLRRKVAALETNPKTPETAEKDAVDEKDESGDSEPEANAGKSFGGQSSMGRDKKKKKE